MELPTPALVINGRTVRRNIERLAAYGREHGIGIRPHTKTHKSRKVAAMQLEAGACGLTVAKVGEAEVMAQVSSDLLLAYPAVDAHRCNRLAKLALDHTVRVGVDSAHAADALAAAASHAGSIIGILVDIDVGNGRTGVQTIEASLELARHVDKRHGVRLDGIMIYPGHIGKAGQDQAPALREVDAKTLAAIDLWQQHGLAATIVSGGSTPTAYHSHLLECVTEIRPGTYVYNDMNIVRAGHCTIDDCAARIVATVVSVAVPGQVILDAGGKTLTYDKCGPAPESGHGLIVEYPDAKITKLSEEHAQVDVTKCAPGNNPGYTPRIGERVTIIPNHICPCVNLQDRVWWMDEDGAIDADAGAYDAVTVDARGMLS